MIDLSGGGGDGDGIVVFGVSEVEVFWSALYIFRKSEEQPLSSSVARFTRISLLLSRVSGVTVQFLVKQLFYSCAGLGITCISACRKTLHFGKYNEYFDFEYKKNHVNYNTFTR
jgi:hypothetical protein